MTREFWLGCKLLYIMYKEWWVGGISGGGWVVSVVVGGWYEWWWSGQINGFALSQTRFLVYCLANIPQLQEFVC